MVSIIIVSYNTKKLLELCLSSIYSSLTIPFEIIVVDNASLDDSVSAVKKKFKKVILIENKLNLGFAKGCNIGAKLAKGDYLLFLNSDTEIRENSVENMVKTLENKEIAIVGGQLFNKNKSNQYSYGPFFSLWTLLPYLLFGEKVLGGNDSRNKKKVDWVSGGFMMIKTTIFRRLEGFDENFFMYIEDMELCFRASKLGYDTYFIPSAAAQHVGQGSSSRTFAVVYIYKGVDYFFRKHKSSIEYNMVRLLLVVKAYMVIIIGIFTKKSYLTKTYKQALKF